MAEDNAKDPGKGDYEVGHSKPPKEHQFKPGQSGNPKGRPKGSKNLATDVSEELSETVPVREGGKVKHITKQRALIKAQCAKGAGGDTRAAQAVFSLMASYLQEQMDGITDRPPSVEDEEIIRLFLEQQLGDLDEGGSDGE